MFACFFFKIQTKFAGHGVNIISHVTMHPDCAKSEFIWTMLARWISTCNGREVPNWLGFDVHDRLASYLNFESGLVLALSGQSQTDKVTVSGSDLKFLRCFLASCQAERERELARESRLLLHGSTWEIRLLDMAMALIISQVFWEVVKTQFFSVTTEISEC